MEMPKLYDQIEVEETLSGYRAIMRCSICNDNTVFSGTSNNKERVAKVVENRFKELHLECNLGTRSAD